MKKLFKWVGIILGLLVGLLLVAAVVLYFLGNSRLTKTYTFPPDNITVASDAETIAQGKHQVNMLCTGCHSGDLGGVIGWFSVGPIGTADSANLTAGKGGIGKEYQTDEDYVKAIRHGVDPQGKPIYMPSVVGFQHLSDQDLGAIIAYLKTVPPVDRQTNGSHFGFLGKLMIGAGMFGKLPVEAVSHAAHVSAPAPGVTLEYGQYLVEIGDCAACHGEKLAGGIDPATNQPTPNLTSGGPLGGWSEQDFIHAMRTGVVPGGQTLNPELMPWREIGQGSDDELKAIWLFLHSLP